MTDIKNQKLIFAIATVSMVVFLGIIFFIFNNTLSSHIQTDVNSRLEERLEPNIISFNLQMEEQVKKVSTFANFLGKNWDLDKAIHKSLLESAVENNGLLRCAIAYVDGSFITHDDKNDGNVSKDAFFITNMKGEFFITDPRPAVVDNTKTVILFSSPIISKDNTIVGSVIYSYLCDDMDNIFNLKSMNGSMNMVVTKSKGDILIGTSQYAKPQENLLSAILPRCTHKNHSPENCLSLNGENGTHILTLDNDANEIYVRYDKLKYNDWYMVATIPAKSATASLSFASQNQRTLITLTALVILAYLGFILLLLLLQRKMVDPDTGSLTIYAFKKKARKIFKHRTHSSFVVVKLDVKDFKLINRIHSYATGDKLIKNIAEALKFVLKSEDTIFARIGVDVFVLLLPYQGKEDLTAKRELFINNFQMLMDEGFSTRVIFPTGQYVLQPSDYPKPDMDEILEKVNFAHRYAKQNSDVIIDYESDIESAAVFAKNIEDRMEDAIKDEEFTLYLQPKVNLKTEKLCGAEALVRWKVDGKYYMYPTDFIPVLEKNGFIVQLDKYMFKCAAKYISECLEKGIKPIPISVNFSRLHLGNKNFVTQICQIADEYNVPRKYLEIELTESAFLGNTDAIVEFIEQLHTENFMISMDDFGSGYSCFAQLKDLKIDVLKIDKGFFSQNEDERRAEVVIAGILKIAQELGIKTVAEGVEYKEQVDILKTLGCDIVQGYYFSKPIPATSLDIENFKIEHIK